MNESGRQGNSWEPFVNSGMTTICKTVISLAKHSPQFLSQSWIYKFINKRIPPSILLLRFAYYNNLIAGDCAAGTAAEMIDEGLRNK